jgi:Fe-S oxidoreductase
MKISYHQKHKIAVDAAEMLTRDNPDILATACPLCKKTLASATDTRVADIAEIVAEALVQPNRLKDISGPDTKTKEKVTVLTTSP